MKELVKKYIAMAIDMLVSFVMVNLKVLEHFISIMEINMLVNSKIICMKDMVIFTM